MTLLICHDQQTTRDLTFWLPLQQIKHAKRTKSCGRVNSCQQCWLDASQNPRSIRNHISLTMAWKLLLWLVIGLCDMITCDDSKLFFGCDANHSMTIFFLIGWRLLFLHMTWTQTQEICMKERQTNVENSEQGNSGQKKGLWTRGASSVIWLGCHSLTWTRKTIHVKLWKSLQMKDTKIQWSAQNKPLLRCCYTFANCS